MSSGAIPPSLLESLKGVTFIPAPKPEELCDRCPRWMRSLWTVEVICYYGCPHKQCETCAARTAKEAREDWSGGD